MRPPVILSAEDNPANRRIIRDLFSRNGYLVIEAANGREAVALARKERPRLILLDVQLPELSGYDAAREIKADEALRRIPIVAVTSYALHGEEARALAAGCDHYISKPFHPRELLELVARLIGKNDSEARSGNV